MDAVESFFRVTEFNLNYDAKTTFSWVDRENVMRVWIDLIRAIIFKCRKFKTLPRAVLTESNCPHRPLLASMEMDVFIQIVQ